MIIQANTFSASGESLNQGDRTNKKGGFSIEKKDHTMRAFTKSTSLSKKIFRSKSYGKKLILNQEKYNKKRKRIYVYVAFRW